MSKALKDTITSNLFWFVASFVVAILIWFIAKTEANPIDQRVYPRPITILADDTMIITQQSSENARVIVTAQEQTLEILRADDITVSVDLTNRPAGEYIVPLDVDISRLASSDTQPRQITVSLEPRISQQIPVELNTILLPVNFDAEVVEQDLFQAVVSGTEDNVSQVNVIRGQIDLSNQQTVGELERTIILQAEDSDGNRVSDVEIEPSSLVVTVDIIQRGQTFTVRPDIDFESLPSDFEFRDVVYEPNTVILDGDPEALATLGDTINTMPISLEDRTGDFTVEVDLNLPEDQDLIVLSDITNIEVQVFISEEETTLPLQNVPVRVVGQNDNSGRTVTLNPTSLSVVLVGPASDIEGIEAEDVEAIVDINSLGEGTFSVIPRIEVAGNASLGDSSILIPAEVTVTITATQPEATESPEGTAQPTQTP
ncbi:MAG: CdaR family protein [Chloroflexota bacterium]